MALALAAMVWSGIASCNDTLEVQPLEYKEDPNFAPPHISEAWGLEEMSVSPEGVYVYKDRLYDRLFTRTLGWNGGDGVLTVGLPDGNVFWTFNDSFYGVADAETRARGNCSFPRNTIMVQSAGADGLAGDKDENLIWLADFVQTTDPDAAGYYKALTHIDHPMATNFNGDGIAQDYLYWSADGTIHDGKVQMMWQGVDNRNGNMEGLGTALAIYSLNGKPGDDSYLKLESVNHDFHPENNYGYGSTLWEDEDGHIYLYTTVRNGQYLGNDPVVARTATKDLNSEWEYYVPNDLGEMVWQKEYPSELQVQNSGIAPGEGSYSLPWVFKKDNWYYMCAQTFPYGHELNIMRSANPWGPFTDHKTLVKFSNPLDELQHDKFGTEYGNLYMLNLHPALSRDGELVISTNTDAKDGIDENGNTVGGFWRNFNYDGSCDWYRPFFFRVFKWERLFEN